MNTIKKIFSNLYVQIIACALLALLLCGALAVLLPPHKTEEGTSCLHGRYRYLNSYEEESGRTVYQFMCQDCRASVREISALNAFTAHKPTVSDGKVVMSEPWRIGAYFTEDGQTKYKVFTRKDVDDWFTGDGALWTEETAIAVRSDRISYITVPQGNAAITYVAEKEGYLRPRFQRFEHTSSSGACRFAILKNGETVKEWAVEAGEDRERIEDRLNELLADTWLYVEKGDAIDFKIIRTDGSYTYYVEPAVELLARSPLRVR